jgi:MoxR-like ATPase
MGYPKEADEMEILRAPRHAYDSIALNAVATRGQVLHVQAVAQQVFVEDSVLDYLLKIVAATRTEAEFKAGISVRGSLALKHAAQARALLMGRDFVVPEDVQELVVPVFAHRLSLLRQSSDPMEERRAVTAALRRIVGSLPSPV